VHSATPSVSQCVETTVKLCNAAGSLQDLDLSEVSLSLILVWYVTIVRSAPWKRHPATSVLKKICAALTVKLFLLHMPCFELTCVQESGFPGFHESDVDASLEAYWDACTWEVFQHGPTPFPIQKIECVIIIC